MAIAEVHKKPEVEKRGEIINQIPIFDIRNKGEQEKIAEAFANYKKIAMFGGVWGIFKAVPEGAREENYFHRVKKGRPKEAKVAMLISPENSHGLIDWDRVHPNLQILKSKSEYKQLWNSHGAFLHIIAPVNSYKAIPDVFQTTPEDYGKRYPGNDINTNTACFIWKDDPYLDNVSRIAKGMYKTKSYIGVSTLNAHGKEPPLTYSGLAEQMLNGEIDLNEIDVIVRDSIYEQRTDALGSHTQIRLPLANETPVLKVVRLGSYSPAGFSQKTGHKTEVIPNAKDVRMYKESIDQNLERMHMEILESWRK